jgi:hypothetical protein
MPRRGIDAQPRRATVHATIIGAALLAAGLSLAPARAEAQAFRHYPFCIYTGGLDSGFERCSYHTFEQCLFDRQAEGGVCYSNPAYVRTQAPVYAQPPRRRPRGPY